MDAFAAYGEFMAGMIAVRKEQPTDDLVSVLNARRGRGRKPQDHQIVTEVLLLPIGGDETTPNAIEEMLRWTAPVKNMARTITADTEFHGTRVKRARR
jgi:cytochrome P450 family 142 subfamily A polypeptide 1